MPITRNEFETGRVLTELEKSVTAFLERNRNNAFSMSEIMDGINIQTSFRDFWKAIASGLFIFAFSGFLNNLARNGKIKMNIINGTYYYTAK
jgi:hypothetical protein